VSRSGALRVLVDLRGQSKREKKTKTEIVFSDHVPKCDFRNIDVFKHDTQRPRG